MNWLREKWRHFWDYYENSTKDQDIGYQFAKFLGGRLFLPFVIVAFFVFFFVLFALYG